MNKITQTDNTSTAGYGDTTVQSSEDVLATNVFAYCENNPASNVDDGGTSLKSLIEDTVNIVFNPVYEKGVEWYSDETGFAGLGFNNPTANNFMDWFRDPWTTTMRNTQFKLGYNNAYDKAAWIMLCYINCLSTEFTYGGNSWRIELWKGRYGISLGCEIGIYYKRGSLFSKLFPGFYDCSDINYPMFSILFLISGANKNPKEKILTVAQTEHWWLTQFAFNVTTPVVLSTNNRLAMIGGIDLRDTQFAITYNNQLQQQHAGKIKSTLFYDNQTQDIWVVILWGDVQNIIYNNYYHNFL